MHFVQLFVEVNDELCVADLEKLKPPPPPASLSPMVPSTLTLLLNMSLTEVIVLAVLAAP